MIDPLDAIKISLTIFGSEPGPEPQDQEDEARGQHAEDIFGFLPVEAQHRGRQEQEGQGKVKPVAVQACSRGGLGPGQE